MRAAILLLLLFVCGCIEAKRPDVVPPQPCQCCAACPCHVTPTPPVPTPTPTPVTEGKRIAIVWHESSQQTPDFSRLRISLTSGEANKYLAGKGHGVLFVDPQDAVPSNLKSRIQSDVSGRTMPVLIVAELIGGTQIGKTLLVESLRPDSTADNVVELVRRAGG